MKITIINSNGVNTHNFFLNEKIVWYSMRCLRWKNQVPNYSISFENEEI